MHFPKQAWEFIKSVRLHPWLDMAEGWGEGVVAETLTEIQYKENLFSSGQGKL